MKFSTALQLGRVSNLPTVWTNVMVGMALVSSPPKTATLILTAVAVSFLYTAGMFLNDVFDREWDRNNRNNRPLVTGAASLSEVMWASAVFIIGAIFILLICAPAGSVLLTVATTFALIALIVLYNRQHKRWPLFSPWVMGACRFMVYIVAATLAGASWNAQLPAAAACLMAYIAGVTYLAQSEHNNLLLNYWPVVLLLMPVLFLLYLGIDSLLDLIALLLLLAWLAWSIDKFRPGARRRVPQGIGALLAGIALIDTAILIYLHQYPLAAAAAAGFLLCLTMQRRISAT